MENSKILLPKPAWKKSGAVINLVSPHILFNSIKLKNVEPIFQERAFMLWSIEYDGVLDEDYKNMTLILSCIRETFEEIFFSNVISVSYNLKNKITLIVRPLVKKEGSRNKILSEVVKESVERLDFVPKITLEEEKRIENGTKQPHQLSVNTEVKKTRRRKGSKKGAANFFFRINKLKATSSSAPPTDKNSCKIEEAVSEIIDSDDHGAEHEIQSISEMDVQLAKPSKLTATSSSGSTDENNCKVEEPVSEVIDSHDHGAEHDQNMSEIDVDLDKLFKLIVTSSSGPTNENNCKVEEPVSEIIDSHDHGADDHSISEKDGSTSNIKVIEVTKEFSSPIISKFNDSRIYSMARMYLAYFDENYKQKQKCNHEGETKVSLGLKLQSEGLPLGMELTKLFYEYCRERGFNDMDIKNDLKAFDYFCQLKRGSIGRYCQC